MGGDEGAQALEPAVETGIQGGGIGWSQMVGGASELAGAAVSIAVWEVGATLRLAGMVAGLASRMSADLAGRASQLVGRVGDAPPNLPEEANRALVLRLYRAAVQADLSTVRKLFAEDVRWQVPDPEPTAGQYRGIAETVPALGAIWRQLGRITAVELRDVVTSPERAAAYLRLSVVQDGRPAVLDRWVVFCVAGGQVTQVWGPFSTEQEP
ncbi:MAG TPA: nuclear transport factor 2 family protein [Actinomycetes bacterium]